MKKKKKEFLVNCDHHCDVNALKLVSFIHFLQSHGKTKQKLTNEETQGDKIRQKKCLIVISEVFHLT